MIKFMIGLIAIVFIGLSIYLFTAPKSSNTIHSESVSTPEIEIDLKKDLKETKEKKIEKDLVIKTTSIKRDIQKEEVLLENEPLLPNSESIDIEEESPEKIMSIEEKSGLTKSVGEDNTPMEMKKMEL